MAKEIIFEVDELTGDAEIEANGYRTVGGKCQGEEATKFIEEALGGVNDRVKKPDFQGGREQRASSSNSVSQR